MGIWEHELKVADWGNVSEICTESLGKRTKDVQIAAWLLEAWLHLYGFVGVREGLATIEDLCRSFWDSLYPSPRDPEYRLSIFQWMNDKLSLQLKFIPISCPRQAANSTPYCYGDWEAAVRADQNARQHPEVKKGTSPEAEEPTIAKFQQSVLLSPTDFFESLFSDLTSVINACLSLESLLDQQYGKDAPSLRSFREIPESIESLIQQILGANKTTAPTNASASTEKAFQGETISQKAPAEPQRVAPSAPIQSRAEAYQRLTEAAEYLLRTEPHSPTPYFIQKAFAWGNMTLDELLPELVRDESALRETMKLLRIESKNQPASKTGRLIV